MTDKEFENIESARKYVGDLIINVLTDRIVVREAIKLFPHDIKDESIKSAYHALIHREADEDLRYRDLLYKDEQDNYLEGLARILQKGQELPKNIIKNYNKYYREIEINHSGLFKIVMKKLCKFLNV
ncbi:hypothetical protein IJG72_01070 [bacterium]|nr:hypothetical protein [bacterium]